MLEQFFHLLSGYVEFQVRGDGSRFFTIAAKRGFSFWGFRRQNGVSTARTKPGSYRKLRPVCRRCQVTTRVLSRRGLPFQLRRLKGRPGLWLGAAAGAALYWFLSGFVWGVAVSGTDLVTPREVLDAAQDYGVFVGAARDPLSAQNAGIGLVHQIPRLSWAAVNTDGCFVEIAVKEGAEPLSVPDNGPYSNIVAAREGQVVEIEAQEGRPEVSIGDTVRAGQLLIAGMYQEKLDPYSPPPEHIFQRAGPARGRVVAETYREFTVQAGATETLRQEGARQDRFWLDIFGVQIPLGLWGAPEGSLREYTEVYQAQALGVALPLAVRRQVVIQLEEVERPLNKEEQQAAALRKLREAQKAALPEGSSVVEEKLAYSFADGICLLQAKCRCREEIGEVRIIEAESP